MNLLILEAHPINDGRIIRHIKYMLENDIKVYHIHINYLSADLKSGFFNYCGENGYRVNFNSYFNGKLKTIHFLVYSLTKKITPESIKGLMQLKIDLSEPTVIHVHDPTLLPLSINVRSIFINSKIVYDRHEVWECFPKYLGLNFYDLFELASRNSISGIVVVSKDHIRNTANIFKNVPICSVPNFPSVTDYNFNIIYNKISNFGIQSEINFIYIGSLRDNSDRDIKLLFKVADNILSIFNKANFQIGGAVNDDAIMSQIQYLSDKYKNRFKYLGFVERKKAIEITQKSNIGLFLQDPNSYWVRCSPNKVFEYLICGVVPIIRADIDYSERLNECSKIFSRYDTEENIMESINELISDKEGIQRLMKASLIIGKDLTWESAAKKYIDLYNIVINSAISL